MKLHYPILCILPAWFIFTLNLQSQVYINEVMASNATTLTDPYFGHYSDWIELFNDSDQELDLSGFFLSDDPANPAMWSFQSGTILPPGDYLIIYADDSGNGLHTNFKLSKEGDQVLLLDPSTSVIDSLNYPFLITDISFGRNPEDLSQLGYFEIPTPGEPNGSQMFSGITSPPALSLESGFYNGDQTLIIYPGSNETTVRYTLDGTDPNQDSPIYFAPLLITGNTVIRVKSFVPGYITGPTATRSFFIDEPQNLPVVSLVTDPDHLFSDETGIYVEGTAGIPGYCTSVPHNVNQYWERPVNIELIEQDGTVGLNQVAGVQIFGGCSRVRYPIKSLAFFARKKYESSAFRYRIFPDKPNDNYETFVLRAAADDQPFTYFRDGLTAMLVKDVIDVDVQAYRPAVLYINGEYWGIHNLREKINEHYAGDNYGVNPDSVDMLKRNPEDSWNIVAGRTDDYNAMMQYLRDHDVTQEVHYRYMETQMDMDEYINYQIIQIFFGGRDWPGNNIKFWRSRETPYNRWRWVLYDLDHMFKEYFSDIMDEATEEDCQCDWPNPPWSTYLFRSLLENGEFRDKFTQRFALYAGTHFSRDRLNRFIDELQAVIAPEIPRHIERWGGQKTDLPDNTWVQPIFSSMAEWEYNVQVMRDFVDTRHEMAMKHVNDYFGTTGYARLVVNPPSEEYGTIQIAGINSGNMVSSVEFFNGESLKISGRVEDGYRLSHWEVEEYDGHDTTLIKQGDDWKYIISWNTPDPSWTTTAYNDQQWESGKAQLGYGDGDEASVLGFGGDPENKIITTWFRKTLHIIDADTYTRYTLNLLRDDGARIFVNGLEVIRDNMQRWAVHAYATAEEEVIDPQESSWFSFGLNPALFREGTNVVAVEVHQADSTSSDLSFDMELVARRSGPGKRDTILLQEFTLDLTRDMEITAVIIPDTQQVDQLFINEIMASNNADLMDEAGEYEDWIELYNAGSGAVDLAGLYLADRYPVVDPWRFPEGAPSFTTIEPGGFLVVFADGDQEQGVLHTDFRLSKEGEEIVLLQKTGPDTLVIDHIVFGTQLENITFGRYPDGSSVLEVMTLTSPGRPNILETTGSDPGFTDTQEIHVYPVPTNGKFFVKFNEHLTDRAGPLKISLYSVSGRQVGQTLYHSDPYTIPVIQLSLDDQPNGLYILKVDTGEKVLVKKVMLQSSW